MENFSFGGGGRKRRDDFIGGRPKSDANYGPKKKRFDKKPGFRGGNDRPKHHGGDRELFATHCTTCGKACEVPFRPDGSKPVLCRDCFAKNNPPERGDFKPRNDFSRGTDRGDRTFRQPERRGHIPTVAPHDTTHYAALTKQVADLETKLNEILSLLRSTETTTTAAATNTAPDNVGETELPKKTPKPKKTAAPKKVAKKAAKKVVKKKTT